MIHINNDDIIINSINMNIKFNNHNNYQTDLIIFWTSY